jgi:hypothetical protein
MVANPHEPCLVGAFSAIAIFTLYVHPMFTTEAVDRQPRQICHIVDFIAPWTGLTFYYYVNGQFQSLLYPTAFASAFVLNSYELRYETHS